MAKTFQKLLEELLIEHPLQMLNHPRSISSHKVEKDAFDVGYAMTYNDNMKKLGSGADATVSQKKSERHEFEDPHHVYKFFLSRKNRPDPTLEYLKHASRNDNPYYPRIHSIKSYKHAETGQEFHVVKMEKLHVLGLLHDPEHSHELEHVNSRVYRLPHKHDITTGMYDLGRDRQEADKHIKDPHLFDALEHIHRIAKKTGKHVGLDLHPGNIMLRRTQYGFHPVITDPLHDYMSTQHHIS